jgi:hypothetical protein
LDVGIAIIKKKLIMCLLPWEEYNWTLLLSVTLELWEVAIYILQEGKAQFQPDFPKSRVIAQKRGLNHSLLVRRTPKCKGLPHAIQGTTPVTQLPHGLWVCEGIWLPGMGLTAHPEDLANL